MQRKKIGLRIFLTCWIIYSIHFMVFVSREHYPALALVEKHNLRVDDYAGYHWDIFRHTDGHYYIGNQVTASVIAAVSLWPAKPLFDRLEAYERAHPAESTKGTTEYRLRGDFRERAREDHRLLKLAAATAVSAVFTMAPLGALLAYVLYRELLRRTRDERRSALLALLFALGTPVFFRVAPLNQNFMLMLAAYFAFAAIRPGPNEPFAPSAGRLILSGFFGGLALALDYAGIVPLLFVYGYALLSRRSVAGFGKAFASSLLYVLGSTVPVAFLCFTQWAMFGHPFLPGQHWMPQDQNNLVAHGWHGFDWPTPSLMKECLVNLDYGLYAFGPLLLLGLVPAFYRRETLVLERRERHFATAFWIGMLLFCAANQFSLLQANSGFRYLLPVVPIIFWQLADHLARVKEWVLWTIGLPAVLHSWVLAMWRFSAIDKTDTRTAVVESWRRFLEHGVTFPWLKVLREVAGAQFHALEWAAAPMAVLGLTGVLVAVVWTFGKKAQSSEPGTAEVEAKELHS